MDNLDNIIENEELETEGSLADDIAKLKAAEEPKEIEEVKEEEVVEEVEEEKEDETLIKAREDYKRRQEERRKQAEQQVNYEKKALEATDDADKQAIEFVKNLQKQQVFEHNIKRAEVELTNLEGEFKVAYPDYDDKVNQALKLTKYRLMNDGMSELEADHLLKREKILLADKAAAQGKDPVEAIYKESISIVKVFERFADDMGYTKGKKKTTLQALREVSRPNAMSGGAGKGATAARKTFDDMEGNEIDDLSIGQMLKGV